MVTLFPRSGMMWREMTQRVAGLVDGTLRARSSGWTLLPMIEEAYLLRSGSSLQLPSIDLAKPKGKEWTEAAFAAIYQELVRHYASVAVR